MLKQKQLKAKEILRNQKAVIKDKASEKINNAKEKIKKVKSMGNKNLSPEEEETAESASKKL